MPKPLPFSEFDLLYFKQICNEIDTLPKIKKIKKGASSDNFLIIGKKNRFFIKIPHENPTQTIQRITKNIILAQKSGILCPKVIICNHLKILCLEFMNGCSISSRKISLFHLEQLWQEYKKLNQIPFSKIHHHPKDLKTLFKSCKTRLNKIKTNSFLKKLCLKKIKTLLFEISPNELIYQKSKIKVMHGDFHNNNIFFQHNKISGILDWEELGIGYATEDWIRFTFCLIERLPNYIQRRKKTRLILKFLISKNQFSKAEWILGFDVFLLYKINKLLNSHNLSTFRLIKTTLFSFFWKKEKNWLLNQVKK